MNNSMMNAHHIQGEVFFMKPLTVKQLINLWFDEIKEITAEKLGELLSVYRVKLAESTGELIRVLVSRGVAHLEGFVKEFFKKKVSTN